MATDLFRVQKKVLIPEHEFKSLLSDSKKTEPNTPFIKIKTLYEKMQKDKIRNKNQKDIQWERVANRLGPIISNNSNVSPNTSPVGTTDKQEMQTESPIDVANYISEASSPRNLTRALNFFEILMRFPEEIQVTKDHIKVNGKILAINTLDLFNNLIGPAKKKLSFAAKPLLEVVSIEPDLLSVISNFEARSFVSQLNRRSPVPKRPSVRKTPLNSVAKNLNSLFDENADKTVDESNDLLSPSPSTSAKRKKGQGTRDKGQGKSSLKKVRWMEHF